MKKVIATIVAYVLPVSVILTGVFFMFVRPLLELKGQPWYIFVFGFTFLVIVYAVIYGVIWGLLWLWEWACENMDNNDKQE